MCVCVCVCVHVYSILHCHRFIWGHFLDWRWSDTSFMELCLCRLATSQQILPFFQHGSLSFWLGHRYTTYIFVCLAFLSRVLFPCLLFCCFSLCDCEPALK